MTTARVSHQRLCRFAITGGECDCHALDGPVDLADIRAGDLVKIRVGRLVSEDWLTVDAVGGQRAADGWWLTDAQIRVTAHRRVGR